MMKKRLVAAGMTAVLLTLLISGCGSSSTKDKLIVLNYGKYIDPEVISMFEEETGISVAYEEYENPEEMYTKYKAGSIDYDLLCTSDYMVERLIEEGDALPLDFSNIPELSNIDETYLDYSTSFDPDNRYSIPYFYGTVGILYNVNMVDEADLHSWDVLWNDKYANSIIMANSVRDSFVPALKKQGFSINSTDEAELSSSLELLKDQKEIVYAYLVDETANEMAAGNAAMALCYSGEAAYAQDMSDDLGFAVPKEGSCLWIDSWIMPKSCTNSADAEAFLNFLCREDIAALNFDYVYYATPNKAVYASLDEEVKEDTTIFPEKAVMDNCEIFTYLQPETTRLYANMWKELKSY